MSAETHPFEVRYDRRIGFRQVAAAVFCCVGFMFMLFVRRPDTVLGSELLADVGLPAFLLASIVLVVGSMSSVVVRRVALRIWETEIEVYDPPRHRSFPIGELRSARLVQPYPMEPHGLRLDFGARPVRVRCLSARDRDLVVAELRRRNIPILDDSGPAAGPAGPGV